MQVGSGEWSNYRVMEEYRPSSRGKAGTSKVVEEKDKRMKTKCRLERSIRYYQKGNGKTQWSEEESEASKEGKNTRHWGSPRGGLLYSLNIVELALRKGIFPLENIVNVCL